jgi:hypothetical protein
VGQKFVMIDYENVQPESLGALSGDDCHVRVFAGAHQNKVDLGLAQALQPFGTRGAYVQIVGNGKDALDFHIAFYIGKLAAEHPGASFTIVSRDTGFDPLVKHLATLNIPCRRINAIAGTPQPKGMPMPTPTTATKVAKKAAARKATAKGVTVTMVAQAPAPAAARPGVRASSRPAALVQARVAEVLGLLAGQEKARPRTVKALHASLKAWIKPEPADADVTRLIEQLSKSGQIRIAGTRVSYALKQE